MCVANNNEREIRLSNHGHSAGQSVPLPLSGTGTILGYGGKNNRKNYGLLHKNTKLRNTHQRNTLTGRNTTLEYIRKQF